MGEEREHQAETKGYGLLQGLKPTAWLISVQMRSRRRQETGAMGWRQARLPRRLKYETGDPRQKKMSATKEGI